MIDRSALQFVSEQAVKSASPLPLETSTPTVVIAGEVVSLENYASAPSRHRARFATSALAHFFSYCTAALADSGSKAAAFVSAEAMSATAIFGIGNEAKPSFCDHTAALKLDRTAEYSALLEVHDKRLPQKAAIDWAIDWADCLQFIDANGDELPTTRAINALRNITIKIEGETQNAVGDTGRTMSALEKAEATSKETLPAGFRFVTETYLGLKSRSINVRVTINTEEAKPTVTLRVVALEKLRQELGQELVEKISENLASGDFTVYAGTYVAGK